MSKLQDVMTPLNSMQELATVKKWEDLTEERQYRFLKAIDSIQKRSIGEVTETIGHTQ